MTKERIGASTAVSGRRSGQDGLLWEETAFGLVPRWIREPSLAAVESVCRQQLAIPSEDVCNVSFHSSCLFNKLYNVKCARGSLIMRISLPVYPGYKTRAEVATLRWVRERTKIPVPAVFSFDDSNDNEIGYEWIIMELMQGTSAYKRWRTMSWEQKVVFTDQIAAYQVQLAGLENPTSMFKGIGTLDLRDGGQENVGLEQREVILGPLVSHEFFMGDHVHHDIQRGPFPSSHDWLHTVLKIVLLHQASVLERSNDEDEREDAEEISAVARKLLSLLPKIFPNTPDEPETTGLYHHDLHLKNIMVGEEAEITAVLDWECVSALPFWVLTMVPKFLDETVREEKPQRDLYADATPEGSAAAAVKRNDPDYLDNEGKNELYFIHLMEYEATQLRKVHAARLKELWPQWPLRGSYLKVDFFQAVSQCHSIWVRRVRRWVDRLEKGDIIRLADV
ncbi:hypothetical protein VTK73DRAFT_7076 [Phialemonium thermophilum]|uniref:Aminoglycoside phosphotransferase domain-containing protein n=1 Tax=Phialemonium thermophilum TaxID=223376 RepID=A0ABR3WGF0_9PEZI